VVGTIVVTTIVHAQALTDSPGPETAGEISGFPTPVLISALQDVHGEEKIYGSIP
jgi:hypothetical protein